MKITFPGLGRFCAPAVLAPALVCAIGLAPASPLRAETTARIVMQAPLRVVDPILTNAYITRNHGYMVFDTLFALDAAGKPQPEMVESWQESADRLTVTLTLRKGLKFHDGSPVTGEDVVASLKRWAQRDVLGLRLMAATSSLESPDADTVVFHLKQPFGMLIEALAKPASPVPFIMPGRIAAVPVSQPITEVVGSGPYQFVAADFQPGVKATYVKFAGYVPRKEPASGFAGAKVAIADRIELVSISDAQTAVNALRRGEIDFVEDVPPDLMPQLEDVKGVALKSYGDSTNIFTMRMNWLQPPFDNPKVRRAVLAAVYQADYLAAQIGDEKMYRLCGAVLSCNSPYASEAGATQTQQPDLAHAKALLKESGYDGSKVVILHPTDLPVLSSLASVTAQALKTIGMNVEIQSMDWATLLSRYSKKDPVAQGGWSIFQTGFTSLDLMNPLTNPNLDGRGAAGYVGWSKSDEMERLRDQFAETGDAARRKEIALAIQKLNYDEVFFIPLGTYSKVKGYNPAKLGRMTDAQIPLFW
ncbi:ABC transporter substrate-binding protein [Achromobacter spanius]|uniref:ABC transporter substrate-binding protein n=1 Tax=Achromobacter spanius TaxID=217203 RepID=UPI00320A04E3